MQKALTGIVLLFMIGGVHAQTWQYTSPTPSNAYFLGPKVGLGTASPQMTLHISGNTTTQPSIMVEATDDFLASVHFKSNGKTFAWSKRPSYENDCMQLWYFDPAAAGGHWQGPYMSVATNGSVGIGTTKTADASYKLFVETGIRTRKIVVDQTAWPDYVFHPDYPLPSLPSVAAYIKANQHLPDMPSADSVAKNGIDLGSNQAQLLKKIEELTLYTIHQDETIRQQAKKLEELEQAVQALQKPSKPTVANTRKMK